MLPEHIQSGFYNLSAYLQAAAMQAEHLCREVEAHRLSRPLKSKGKKKIPISPEHEVKETNNRNIDIINAVNFAIFDEIEGTMVAKEGLRSTLRWRKDRSSL